MSQDSMGVIRSCPRLAKHCTVSAQALTSKADLDTTFTKIKRDTYTGSSTYKSE
jgi:hypothetical protein